MEMDYFIGLCRGQRLYNTALNIREEDGSVEKGGRQSFLLWN
jgi:hypothetical protein